MMPDARGKKQDARGQIQVARCKKLETCNLKPATTGE
jgi:hypothetical protein